MQALRVSTYLPVDTVSNQALQTWLPYRPHGAWSSKDSVPRSLRLHRLAAVVDDELASTGPVAMMGPQGRRENRWPLCQTGCGRLGVKTRPGSLRRILRIVTCQPAPGWWQRCSGFCRRDGARRGPCWQTGQNIEGGRDISDVVCLVRHL